MNGLAEKTKNNTHTKNANKEITTPMVVNVKKRTANHTTNKTKCDVEMKKHTGVICGGENSLTPREHVWASFSTANPARHTVNTAGRHFQRRARPGTPRPSPGVLFIAKTTKRNFQQRNRWCPPRARPDRATIAFLVTIAEGSANPQHQHRFPPAN